MRIASYIYFSNTAPTDLTQLWAKPVGNDTYSLQIFNNGAWRPLVGSGGKSAYELAVEKGYSGTLEEWLLSLKGVQGNVGPQGEQGPAGPQGPQGEAGTSITDISYSSETPTSTTYIMTFSDGSSFAFSIPKGEKGDKGDTGATGEKGEKGDKGDTGAAGTDGTDGKSAYEVAVDEGYTGTKTQWLTSLKGEQGDPFTYAGLTAAQKAEIAQDATTQANLAAGYLSSIQSAIDALDPSQSTEDAVAALALQVASNDVDIASIYQGLTQPIDGEIETSHKITGDGEYVSSTASSNRTLVADVSDYVGKVLWLSGRLYAGSSYCWYAFHDESDNVLLKSDTGGAEQLSFVNAAVIVPVGAKTLYVQGSSNVITPSAVCSLIDKANGEIEGVKDIVYIDVEGSMLTLMGINDDGSVSAKTGEGNRTLLIDVSKLVGVTLLLSGRLYSAINTYCWYAFHNDSGSVIAKSNVSDGSAVTYIDVPVTVPTGATKLYIQGHSSVIFPSVKMKIDDFVFQFKSEQENKNPLSKRKFPLAFTSISAGSGRVATASNYTNGSCKHTVEYIKVHNSIKLYGLGGTTGAVSAFFYDKDMAFISYVALRNDNGVTDVVVDSIPQNAVWFRMSFANSNSELASKVPYNKLYVEIESEWDGNDTMKEPYREYTPFLYAVKCNIPIKLADNPSITTKSVFGFDEGLLHLPSSYTPDGKSTPLIFYLHGDAERYTIGESTFSGHIKMQQCWSDAGFAQVDLDLIPSIYNEPSLASTGGTRDDLECLSAAWEWIINHFNIDKRGFYLIGRSRGGQAVLEILGKGGATRLPIIAAISMAGANSIFEYSVYSKADSNEWQLWCNAHGLPTSGRPTWGRTDTTRSFLSKTECYNFVVNNWDLWWRKALTGWGMITKNTEEISPRDFFDDYVMPVVNNNGSVPTTGEVQEFLGTMLNTMEMKSPVPLRFDWCVGDQTQTLLPFDSIKNYSNITVEILLNTPASLAEYRRWDGVDNSNPYSETDPHYAENMIFYSGNLTLPNGVVTSNPSKVAMEWLIWCMGHDPRFDISNYSLPNGW